MKRASVILLEALFAGQEIEMQLSKDLKLTFAIVETEDKGWQLCHIMYRYNTETPLETQEPEKQYMIADLSVNQLLRYAETLSDEDLFIISSNTAMRKMSKDRFRMYL